MKWNERYARGDRMANTCQRQKDRYECIVCISFLFTFSLSSLCVFSFDSHCKQMRINRKSKSEHICRIATDFCYFSRECACCALAPGTTLCSGAEHFYAWIDDHKYITWDRSQAQRDKRREEITATSQAVIVLNLFVRWSIWAIG